MLIKNEYKPQMLPKQPKGKKPVSTNGRIAFVLGGLALAFAAFGQRDVQPFSLRVRLLGLQSQRKGL
ncbi:MAG TPA: hypothetical protein PLK27_10285, partial [Neisseria sp.]|nr:hypothetical protein [Neisseria sp.]